MNPIAHRPPFPEDAFVRRLLSAAETAGIPLSQAQALHCYRHAARMLQWNASVNLTRIVDLEGIVSKHIIDSLLPGTLLPHRGWVLDVGTGPGFPGIPLKILHPELQIVLLESARKKCSFLKVIAAELAMDGIRIVNEKWERFAVRTYSWEPVEGYDAIVMRAVRLEPDHLLLLARGKLAQGGLFAWWTTAHADTAPAILTQTARQAGLEPLPPFQYDLGGGPRHVLFWRRIRQEQRSEPGLS
jgi:16S rRNA (guanine527-N7)-methyltransferase